MKTPFDNVTQLFDGTHGVAKAIGITEGQVRRWRYPRDKGGADGNVPVERWAALLRAAKEKNKRLPVRKLLPPEVLAELDTRAA